jgi:hypothetical protein
VRRVTVVVVAVVVGAALVIAAVVATWQGRASRDSADLSDTTAGEARCGPVLEAPVDSNKHVPDGPITYSSAPPAAGAHRDRWAYYSRNFYDMADRPEVGELVHNLEHGYNVLWYDDTVIEEAELLNELRVLAASYDGARRNPTTALIAAPWTADDGAPFPDGMNYALTHWYADPTDRTRSRADERALTQYCADLSPDAVQDWMDDYPLQHAPEGFSANM